MSSNAAGAVLTKVRSRFGKMIKPDEYRELSTCRSIADVISSLRRKPMYEDMLRDVKDSTVRRGYLEYMLTLRFFDEINSIGYFWSSADKSIYKCFLEKEEISLLLLALRNLSIPVSERMPVLISSHFEDSTQINFQKLFSAENYTDFVDALKDNKYKKIFMSNMPAKNEAIPYTEIEADLQKKLFADYFDTIGSDTDDTSKSEISEIMLLQAEMLNLNIIYRLKKYYSTMDIDRYLLPFNYKISAKMYDMLKNADLPTFIDIIDKSPLDINFDGDFYNFEIKLKKMLYKKSLHFMRFSTSPDTVVVSYLNLFDSEKNNIIKIVEGVRYSLPPEEIIDLLIF